MTFEWITQSAAVGTYAQLTNLEYQYADELHGRAALSDFLNFAQNKAEGNATDAKVLEIEVARTYVRLAVLTGAREMPVGYQSDLARAQAALQAAGSPHASAEDVERSVNQLESHQ